MKEHEGLKGAARRAPTQILSEVSKMFAYLCRRCDYGNSEFILEQMEDPGSGHSGSTGDPHISNACPSCRTLFSAENYFVLQSAEPLTQHVQTSFHNCM